MRITFRTILIQSSTLARAALALVATSIFAANAFAEPPSRVGRVSLVEGNVSFFMDRNEGWKPARINFPVTSENSLWTEGASRAEVRVGPMAMRLDDNTILDFIRIDDDQTLAYLQRGSVNIRTRQDGGDSRETLSVETADGRFVVEGNGRFRIDAADNGAESRISVYSGRARFEAADNNANSVTVDRGRTLVVQGRNSAQPGANSFRFETAAESGFDRWADARDRAWDRTHSRYVSSQVVSSYMTGYEELDTHGDWIESGEYGRVWAPRYVSSGWAPYRNGSWSYVSPWGWTWVDEAPWGFAPFHYGRWVTIGSRWHWWPGAYQRRPAYAPALVAWYGRPGLSVNVSVRDSSVGWFPLAPREHYVPRYTNNVNYIRNVNYVTNNVTIINNNPPARYQNQVPGATFVNQNVFAQSKPIAANTIRDSRANLANFQPVQTIDVPRPVVQGQPVMPGQPQQQGNGNANSVWARGRNNVAPVYAPQMQGQIQGQVQGQAQQGQDRGSRVVQGQPISGGQIQPQQNQIPARVGGEVAQGAAPGMPGGNNNVQPARGGANRDTPPAIGAAPVMNGGVIGAPPNPQPGNAKPMPVAPPPQPAAQPAPQPVAVQPRVGGAQNVVPPPAPIAVQSQQRPPVMNQSAQPTQQPPQPAYVQGRRPNAVNTGEQAGQPRVRENRVPESGEPNGNFRSRPQREVTPQNAAQNVPQNAVPQQRNDQRNEQRIERQAPQPRVQPQPQQQAQPPQQPRPQGQPQPQQQQAPRPEKPQPAPRVEGQAKPLQQQQ
jgi:hypothetical protein